MADPLLVDLDNEVAYFDDGSTLRFPKGTTFDPGTPEKPVLMPDSEHPANWIIRGQFRMLCPLCATKAWVQMAIKRAELES